MICILLATLLLASALLPCTAQTLADELRRAGIPDSRFNQAELAQTVNSATSHRVATIYLAYMRVDANNLFTGSPPSCLIRLEVGKAPPRRVAGRRERGVLRKP